MILFGDLETYCETPLAHGTYRYAESAEVMLFAYAIDDGPAACWDLAAGERAPSDLSDALGEAAEFGRGKLVFQNSMFDRTVMRLAPNFGYEIAPECFHDTMVQALAHSLPGGLEKLCEILNVPQDLRKLKDGRALIHLFCKPRPANSELRRATRLTHPTEWQRFKEYAVSDVESMRDIYRKLPRWNYSGDELALWHLDQRINDRGICVDLDLARAAIKAVKREKDRLAKETQEITNGEVQATTQRDVLLAHILAEHGVTLPDLKKDTIERRLGDPELPDAVKWLLATRLEASSTSVTKYNALMRGVTSDGRLHGTIQFDGAGRTGRSAGRMFQPHNLTRVPRYLKKDYDAAVEAIKADVVDLAYEKPIEVCGSVVRGAIIAPPGRKLVVSDLSNIEGRMLAWLAGEDWKLRAFAHFDEAPDDKARDLYNIAYARSFMESVAAVVADAEAGGNKRQVGKVQELALGYEGGVGAFVTFAAVYGLDLEAMAEDAWDTLPADVIEEARGMWEWTKENKRPTFGLSQRAFMACDAFKRLWRRGHPQTTTLWKKARELARDAIESPGRTLAYRALTFDRHRNWLRIRLPSGRFLCYPHPRVDTDGAVSYMGMNQYTKRWQRIGTYGGKLVENITQAAARDVLMQSQPRAEAAGYEIVLHVHDELITEVPDTPEFTAAGLGAILAAVPAWAPGLPLAAGGYETHRYRKD